MKAMSRCIILKMRTVSNISCTQNKKHAFYVEYLLSENRAVYKTMWKNVVEPDRSQITI